jgi:hypothetical protein
MELDWGFLLSYNGYDLDLEISTDWFHRKIYRLRNSLLESVIRKQFAHAHQDMLCSV